MEKGESIKERKGPLKRSSGAGGGPPRTIHSRPWNDDDDDSNAYFMSEPSVSEAESSEYVRNFPSLLAPRAESPSSTSSQDLLPDAQSSPAPQQQQQQHQQPRAHLLSYPISPGTSLSSWDSPHFFRKKVQLYFSPDRPSNNLEVPAAQQETTRNNRAAAAAAAAGRPSNQSTSSEGSAIRRQSDQFLRDLKQYSVGAVKDARPEDFDSDRSQHQLNGADRQEVNAVIRNIVPVRNTGAAAAPLLHQADSNDQDETIVMDLSASDDDEVTKTTEEPLDWEVEHSADDEKTKPERPRRAKRPGGGHRRTRSGDEAAASLMTGGKEWKGMQIDQLPIPSEHDEDEDEHDHSQDSEDVHHSRPQQQGTDSPSSNSIDHVPSEGSGVFAVGSGKNLRLTKKPRRNQRVRRPAHRAMDRHETDSTLEEKRDRMSRDAFSRFALESPRALPKYVTTESRSTIDQSASDRIESDSSGHGSGARHHVRSVSDMNFNIPNRHQRTLSDAEMFQPNLQRRVSEITYDSSRGHGSPFSWLPSKHDRRLSGSWDPRYSYAYNAYQFGDAPETPNRQGGYQFGNADEGTPDDTGSDYSRSDYDSEEEERDVQSNRLRYGPDMKLDELERLLEDGGMRGRAQHVLRHRLSPFSNLGKRTPSTAQSRASYKPISENVGDYPTFVCPVCKTRQREFFTAASAPSQFQGPTGFLALYFAIYVIASLFIFGLKEGWKPLDCVYFAVITLTTAGLGDFTPTSDGAKIMCSVFIYFGVATIGLLLGSYLASMLDDKSYKQAQRNRVENCPNCIRMKNMRTLQLRRAREKQKSNRSRQSSIHSQKSALGFMSERHPNDHSHLGPHVLEAREQKRVRTHKSPDLHVKSSNEPKPSRTVEQKAVNTVSSGVEAKVQQSGVGTSEKETGASETTDEVKHELDVERTPTTPQMSAGSPDSMFGSPLTSDILGRQSHTRHMSFGVHDLSYGSTSTQFRRHRKYSEDLSRPSHLSQAIPENAPVENQSPKSWSQQNPIVESESEYESDEESTDESEISTESDATLDEATRRIKTAKYVFLTLKQALMNSVVIIMIGGIGFYMIEEMSAVDSFYFTTVLLTTVGYGDIVPVTSAGKLFATIYVLVAGTVLLHNMSLISFIPLELRKRRIEQAVLTQFGDQLDDAALRELATGPLVQNLQLNTHSTTGLEECTREMFALAMLVRLGKVSETDIKQTFKAFRRLDVDDDGMLTTKSIIAGMVQKHRSTHGSMSDLRKASQSPVPQPPPPPPPPPFVDPAGPVDQGRVSSPYRFGNRGTLHVPTEHESFLMRNNTGYDSFSGQRPAFGPDLEQGYPPRVHQYGEESRHVAK